MKTWEGGGLRAAKLSDGPIDLDLGQGSAKLTSGYAPAQKAF